MFPWPWPKLGTNPRQASPGLFLSCCQSDFFNLPRVKAAARRPVKAKSPHSTCTPRGEVSTILAAPPKWSACPNRTHCPLWFWSFLSKRFSSFLSKRPLWFPPVLEKSFFTSHPFTPSSVISSLCVFLKMHFPALPYVRRIQNSIPAKWFITKMFETPSNAVQRKRQNLRKA